MTAKSTWLPVKQTQNLQNGNGQALKKLLSRLVEKKQRFEMSIYFSPFEKKEEANCGADNRFRLQAVDYKRPTYEEVIRTFKPYFQGNAVSAKCKSTKWWMLFMSVCINVVQFHFLFLISLTYWGWISTQLFCKWMIVRTSPIRYLPSSCNNKMCANAQFSFSKPLAARMIVSVYRTVQ